MPKRAQVTMSVLVTFDPGVTSPDALASALDTLIETALSTSGVLDEHGRVDLGPVETGAEVRFVEES